MQEKGNMSIYRVIVEEVDTVKGLYELRAYEYGWRFQRTKFGLYGTKEEAQAELERRKKERVEKESACVYNVRELLDYCARNYYFDSQKPTSDVAKEVIKQKTEEFNNLIETYRQ